MSDPVTPNLGLTLPVAHEQNYNVPVNENFTLIDTFAGEVPYLSATASQAISQAAGTYFAINALQVYGSVPTIRFGVAVGTWDGALTRTGAGTFTLDSGALGNADGSLSLALVNVSSGLQYGGAAPSGHILIGNGTEYVDGYLYYQTIQEAGTGQTQRASLNFLSPLTVADNSGGGSTDISLAASGVTAGSYVNANITVGADGRVSAAANGNGAILQSGTFLLPGLTLAPYSTYKYNFAGLSPVSAGQVVSINLAGDPGAEVSYFAYTSNMSLFVVVSNPTNTSKTTVDTNMYYKIF